MDFLACRLGLMQLGIPRSAVLEVLEVGELSAVPGSQPWVAGVGLVRGTATLFVTLDGQRTRHTKAVRVPIAPPDAVHLSVASRFEGNSFLALLVDDTGRFVEVDEVAQVERREGGAAVAGATPFFSTVGRISVGISGLRTAAVGSVSADERTIWMYQPDALAKALG